MLIIVGVVIPQLALAQLSPGKLSRPHSQFEGLRKCGTCHELGNREVLSKCLDCHDEIQAMRTSGSGLHGGDDFSDCVDCHVEHKGFDVSLVYWDQGQEGFDHGETGYKLQGSHRGLECRKCHTLKKIQNPGLWRAKGKDLERTFLGLSRECLACHEDRHQGQLGDDCLRCHDQVTWKKQPGFDHQKAAFALEGLHRKVECVKCHASVVKEGQSAPVTRYRPVDFANCTSCHDDPHQGGLGASCSECHTTRGWLQLAAGKFDHSRTRYPLLGRHAKVNCQQCHGAGTRVQQKKLSFARCLDCHADEHKATERGRPAWSNCEDCHDVEGFTPSRYTLAMHQKGSYLLVGSHLAVPCGACHRQAQAGGKTVVDLAPASGDCRTCHKSPHGNDWQGVAGTGRQMECRQCHQESSWRATAQAGGFDHRQTGFPLTGRHGELTCRACHDPAQGQAGKLVFKGAPKVCAVCHKDPHGGQFVGSWTLPDGQIDCGHCHVTSDWLAEKFNHETDTRFPLRGSHEKTSCVACHHTEKTADGNLIRYKPLPLACAGCHTAEALIKRGQS